ncbi:MAG: ATP-dependent DNA helicase RecG [Rhodoferax sp.]|nr:ATP-dependent DNA helicase RecG [Rhodoferax sp.]
MADDLTQTLDHLRLGDRIMGALDRLKLKRVIDVLNHFPRGYNRRTTIGALKTGMTASVTGKVLNAATKAARRSRVKVTEVVLQDATGSIKAVFFNQPWIAGKLLPGLTVRVSGPVEYAYHAWTIKPTSFEINPAGQEPGLEPEYALTQGIESSELADLVSRLIHHADGIADPLPEKLAAGLRLMPVAEAYRQAHKPANDGALQAALLALKYREFFLLQAGLRLRRRSEAQDTGMLFHVDEDLRARALKYFPFEMTGAQKRVCAEIERDLSSPGRMHRLLQGDVGSGKTAVALYAALIALDNGYQAAFMAPTEVLARQHFRNLSEYLRKSKVRVDLLVGGMKKSDRDRLCDDLESGKTHIIVGTHALIEDYVKFRKLGLCVIDEQHKFGVNQRAALRAKGNRPHILAMSATPIPRTLAMGYYADLDVSTIDSLPPGRTPIVTKLVNEARRDEVIARIRDQLAQGRQVYWVCPLIEESEALDLANATETHAALGAALADAGGAPIEIGLLHSRMPVAEKKAVMDRFISGRMGVLVSTTVIEVGVDVPNASLMVVEHAERFGLSQLHQLRGRVGRGAAASACVLMYSTGDAPRLGETARARLKAMAETADGFEIARRDLEIRGPGEFLGARQSGAALLRFADLATDAPLLEWARDAAPRLLDRHPDLARQHVARWLGGKAEFLKA